ncbi:MAG TPA: hypothetical protein VGX00_00645 [Thermoplasmata archaeon]|nr:hypothetical protein [Thermoplasmata archaeon]
MALDIAEFRPRLAIGFTIRWEDPDGVSWGFFTASDLEIRAVDPKSWESTEQSFVVTTRTFLQALPLPEVKHETREALLATPQFRELHFAYEEARDSMIAGLPNASAAISGKALETAVLLRGSTKGWPVGQWGKSRYALGDLLREQVVREDVEAAFGSGFYRLLVGTNVPRILGAHQKGTHVHMDEARAVLRALTTLIDGWFYPGHNSS